MVWYASYWGPSCLPNIMGCWRIWNRTPPLCWKNLREKTPQFDALLAVLEPEMQQYRSKGAARSEFKAVKRKLERIFPKSTFFGRFGTFSKTTHRKRSGFTWPVFGWFIRLPVATKALWRRKGPQFLRSFIQGPRTRTYPEKFWRKTQITAPGCENDQSRITRSQWEEGALIVTVRWKLF